MCGSITRVEDGFTDLQDTHLVGKVVWSKQKNVKIHFSPD